MSLLEIALKRDYLRGRMALEGQSEEKNASIDLLLSISDYIVLKNNDFLSEKKCANAKQPKFKEILPEGYVHIYQFEQKTLICSASWLRRWIKQVKFPHAIKFKGQWYVHPTLIIDDLSKCTQSFPKVARKAKFYLKNNSAK